MSGLKPPQKLCLTGNLLTNYEEWLRSFEVYATASENVEKSEKIQCNTFLHVAGPEAQKVFATFKFADQEKDKIEPLKAKFREYCEGKKNVTVIRYRFNTTVQQEGQSFDSYLTELRNKVKTCDYGELENSLLKDRIICGIKDDTTREKLLQTDKITLDTCVDICRLAEINISALNSTNKDVSAINETKSKQKYKRQGKQVTDHERS